MPRVGMLLALMLVLAGSACSADPTLGEYAEDLEALVIAQNARLDELDAELSGTTELEGVRTYASERLEARRALIAGIEALEPPESVADLHHEAIEVLERLTDAEAVLAAKVEASDSLISLGDLWNTPEGVEARSADERAVLICEAAQDTFDRTQAGTEFDDVPWIPPEMRQVIDVAFGCRAEDRR